MYGKHCSMHNQQMKVTAAHELLYVSKLDLLNIFFKKKESVCYFYYVIFLFTFTF